MSKQGNKGRLLDAEWSITHDPLSGAAVRQLTDYMGHSYHTYFTNNGWYDQAAKLLFASDRENDTNLYSLDLVGGAITQLTDFRNRAFSL